MAYNISLSDKATEDMQRHILVGNKKLVQKIEALFEELEEHPFTGTGKPEHLKYQIGDIWSRRVDSRHRMVYRIYEDTITVVIIRIWGHYGDK